MAQPKTIAAGNMNRRAGIPMRKIAMLMTANRAPATPPPPGIFETLICGFGGIFPHAAPSELNLPQTKGEQVGVIVRVKLRALYRFVFSAFLAAAWALHAAETGQLDASPSLFTVMAAINAAGYDADLASPNNHPLRMAIRQELAKRKIPSLPAHQGIRRKHTSAQRDRPNSASTSPSP